MLKRPVRGVICCGSIVIDTIVRPVESFVWGSTAWVESVEQHLGGNGANTSYTLAMLGVPARLLGKVGRDNFGEQALSILQSGGVDVSYVTRSVAPTTASVCPVRADGARLFLQRVGSSVEVFPEPIEFSADLITGMTHFHMANPFALPKLREHAGESLARARCAGLTTSLDAGWDARGRWLEDIAPCLSHVDLMFLNQDEARMLSGQADPDLAARRMREMGAGAVVVKLGPDGCATYTSEGCERYPAFDVEVVDTTGAGDCFVAGFLAALAGGGSTAEAARLANAAGAMSVQKLGGISGIRSRAETEAWLRTAPPLQR